MGGLYGKLLITAFITFVAVISGFIIVCMVQGKKRCKPSQTPNNENT